MRPHSLPLHDWRYVERAKVYARRFNLLLNPANVLPIGRNNPDFIELEELIKVLVFAHFIPAEQALDHRAHRLEVHGTREGEI